MKAGETLYEVRAWSAPQELDGKLVKIADIVLETDLVTSKVGDTRLAFQHRRVMRDGKYWPRAWVKLAPDQHFKNTKENNWGMEVPATWPDNDEDA